MAQIVKKFIGDNQVGAAKERLENNTNMRARNAADSADINILKVNASDVIEFASLPQAAGTPSNANDLVNKAYADGVTGGATTALDNLASVQINVPLVFGPTVLGSLSTNTIDSANSQDLDLSSGTTTTSGTTGAVNVNSGDGVSASGVVTLASGVASAGPSGAVNINSGNAASNSDSGSLVVQSAAATGTGNSGALSINSGTVVDGISGDLNFNVGTKSGTGSRGSIVLRAPDMNLASGDGSSPATFSMYNPAGTFKTSITAAPSLAADYALTLPINDGNSGDVLSSNGSGVLSWVPNGAAGTWNKENLTLNGTDITNQYKDLAQVILASSLDLVVNGVVQTEGTDYTVSLTGGAGGKTRISFAGDLATGGGAALVSGDILRFKYQY